MKRFLFLLLTVWFILAGASGPEQPQYKPKEQSQAEITFFNIPDGEATLLQSDRRRNYLFNTGETSSLKFLKKELERLEVKKIKGIVLTGQTSDFCGNLKEVVTDYDVEEIFYTGSLSDNCNVPDGVSTVNWKEGDRTQLDGVSLQVIYTENEQMSLHLSFHETGIIFFTKGDLEEEVHISNKSLPPFQILKIGNYGTGTSPTEQFLEKTDPHLAVLFTRKGTSVNDGLIERMHGFWMDVYRLQQTGTTTIEIGKDQYHIPSD
ncbi:hypothetical protein GCM10007216_17790 [Thalassobacillus devorans]|uniref:Hydrolase n=1 Tax=Thalassobacillus devorans TaxID=279813 RepID=A0ABQ1NZW5_9BACI|nr:hypothetical protein [Thalassobacillus devorans]NIK28278.1 beta-lactamase superfamily II metal-dependent hydrolase [Thalassobacillus devorans]GGC87504.1 hypothetical protein GCM10007216_17790 [Thalassobacillus devorans]